MKKLISALAALMVTVTAYGQGEVLFNTAVGTDPNSPSYVNARVLLPGGAPAGAGFTAQLYGGTPTTDPAALTPLTPTTTFRTSGAGMGYVVTPGTSVVVPGVPSGQQARIVMRAFNGSDFTSSLIRGESAPITITLGGGLVPPANLVGLQGFTMEVVPEPSTIALAVLGAGGLLLFRRRK